jgi:lipopolysaccharide transport system ATP-binding protein
MANINFQNVAVEFPIYDASSRSLKKRVMNIATGGRLGSGINGGIAVRALDELTFELNDGDRVALLGHNGAGKSTLLRVLSGVYRPSLGVAKIHGICGSLIDISLGIDYEATGRENIYIRGILIGLSKSEINQRMDEIIDFSELGDFIDMPVRTYSSGMHLRLAFSVATILKAEILIMDEWLSIGDEGFKSRAEERISSIIDSTSILVIATHSRQVAEDLCNRVIWLEGGKIKMDGTPDLVLPQYFK